MVVVLATDMEISPETTWAALSPVEIQSWFLVSSRAEFEIFFPPLLVISEKKTGRFYSTVSY